MTILVGLTCNGAAAVAADRRMQVDGRITNDFRKTFAYRDGMRQVIGGICGQLMHGDRPLPHILESLCERSPTLDELAEALRGYLWDKVPAQNTLTVLLAGSASLTSRGNPEMRTIVFHPAIGPRPAGDAQVSAPQHFYIDGAGRCPEASVSWGGGWNAGTVEQLAGLAVRSAIEVSQRPGGSPSCGGEPSIPAPGGPTR